MDLVGDIALDVVMGMSLEIEYECTGPSPVRIPCMP